MCIWQVFWVFLKQPHGSLSRHVTRANPNGTQNSHSPLCQTGLSTVGVKGQSWTYRLPPVTHKAPISWWLCLCLCSPWVLLGPGKSLGHTDTDLSSATLRLIPDFMGAREGGRVRALHPAGASLVSTPTSRDLIVQMIAPPRAATWEGSHFMVTPWHQNVTSNSKVQRACSRQMSPNGAGVSEARLLQQRCRGMATVAHRASSS